MKKLVIAFMLFALFGCEQVAEETGSRSAAYVAPVEEETPITRPYTHNQSTDSIVFSDHRTAEIDQILYNRYPLPDTIILYTPNGMTPQQVTIKVRGSEVTTTLNGNLNNCVNVVVSQNAGGVLGEVITMNVTEDVLDYDNPNDIVAIYHNNNKICYWYLSKF